MRRKCSLVILLALLTGWSIGVQAAQQRALSEHDLLELLAGGVYNSRIAELVRDRGITFVPTARDLASLRRAGADLALLNTVESARHFTAQLPGRSRKPQLERQVAPPAGGNLVESIPHNAMLPDALPPTTLVASSPSASPSPSSVSPQSGTAVMVRSAADPKPSIIWHQVHGRWHWHCVAHCSKFRHHHESLSKEASEFYDSSSN